MGTASVVGARPQFIKCAPVSREIRKVALEILIHTGQHYDENMSHTFFSDLNIPEPDYNLKVGSGPHGAQSGEMLKRIEEVLLREEPDWVLVYGDTNSTLAGALAAAKLHIPVAHVEAGLRSFNRRMPEEINRVVTDHLSSLLLCPTETAATNLAREGIVKGIKVVGDVMYDTLLYGIKLATAQSTILNKLQLKPKTYLLATVHRAENTDDSRRLRALVQAFERSSVNYPLIWPLHPRTRKALTCHNLFQMANQRLRMIEPVSYLDMLLLAKEAKAILTDSGGLQKEAYWLSVPCVTLREQSEWVETVQAGWNTLAGADPDRIFAAVTKPNPLKPGPNKLFGDGHSATKIAQALLSDNREVIPRS